MKKIGILKSIIIAVIILIIATIMYALCSEIIFKNKKEENKSIATLHTIEHNNEQIEKSEIINVEISNERIQDEETKVFKIGVQQVQQLIIKEAEKKAEKEKDKKDKDKNEKEDENFKKIEGSNPYYIRVNYQANTVTVYTKDEKGKYTVPYKAMICSCGTWTPHSGTYALSYRSKWRALFGGVNGKYATDITGDILFHSVPYVSQSSDSLEYWEFDKLGTTASLGCVRLQVKDAKWIYDNCGWGTLVEFYASSDPGPLGKPSAPKISSNEKCRDWDPTDPEKGNPWNTYEEEKEEKDDDKDKNTSSNKNNVTDKNNTVDKNNTTNKDNNETNKSEVPKKEETTKEDNNTTNKKEPVEDKKEENEETQKTENEEPKQEENKPEQEKPDENIPGESEPEDEPKEEIPEQPKPEENKPEETNPSGNENKGEEKLDDVA